MTLVIIALVLFIGLVACWLMLPDGTSTYTAQYEADIVGSTVAQQPA